MEQKKIVALLHMDYFSKILGRKAMSFVSFKGQPDVIGVLLEGDEGSSSAPIPLAIPVTETGLDGKTKTVFRIVGEGEV